VLVDYYQIKSSKELQAYLDKYIALVKNVAGTFDVNLTEARFKCDHLGMQVLSSDEFDQVSELLSKYSKVTRDNIIHDRRNRIFQFNTAFNIAGIEIPRIEIFEPKPNADSKTLKLGIEHISFKVEDYDEFLSKFEKQGHPIDKKGVFDDGSKFFKTMFVNVVELEFRNDFLGVGPRYQS